MLELLIFGIKAFMVMILVLAGIAIIVSGYMKDQKKYQQRNKNTRND